MNFQEATLLHVAMTMITMFHLAETVSLEKFFVTSINCGLNKGDQFSSSIIVSGKEYSQQSDGINIIVYDIARATVVQSKSFTNPNTREFMRFVESVFPGKLIIGTSQILCTEKSAIDFEKQKSILYSLRRLRIHTRGLKPLVFRSAVFAFCKEECYPNITSSIPLPYSKIHDFKEGPILLSFRIKKVEDEKSVLYLSHQSTVSSNNSGEDTGHSSHSTLYIIVIACSILILSSIIAVAIILVRRHRQESRKLNHEVRSDSFCHFDPTNRRVTPPPHCELLYLSKEKSNCYQQGRYAPTTSARLFSLHSNDGGGGDGGDSEEVGTMDGFASYVTVETEDHQLIYKIPSGVSKHDPPSHPPSLKQMTKLSTISGTRKTTNSSNEYLSPHDYADPGTRDDGTYQEVDPGYFEEYTSLEPNEEEEELGDETESIDLSAEPIYDNI